MRITEIRECSIPVSRHADPALPSGGLTTSLVEIVTDVMRAGKPVTGRGYASVGRYAQSGLLRDRFIPRLLKADAAELLGEAGNFDPFEAWDVMMKGEKPGGHGERCVAVGALDMALWDIAAKIAGEPLCLFLAKWVGRDMLLPDRVRVYAGGGYPYPHRDAECLADEMRRIRDLGFTHAKMKIGSPDIPMDLKRIEAAAQALGNITHLAVDAMNAYSDETFHAAARALAPLKLWWFEDICDPHDFNTQSAVAALYPGSLGAGEALFSVGEARLLDAHGGLRRDRDVLLFDPVHCYGVPGYLRIIDALVAKGWPQQSFWPHGGHLFSLHLVAALGLGGAEITPFAFHPFSQLSGQLPVTVGHVDLPREPGIGFELNPGIMRAFAAAFA
jgi:D(-)-tartrate dehydratase